MDLDGSVSDVVNAGRAEKSTSREVECVGSILVICKSVDAVAVVCHAEVKIQK